MFRGNHPGELYQVGSLYPAQLCWVEQVNNDLSSSAYLTHIPCLQNCVAAFSVPCLQNCVAAFSVSHLFTTGIYS